MKMFMFLLLILYATVHDTCALNRHKALFYLKKYGYTLPQCDRNELICRNRRLTFESRLEDFQRQFKLNVTGELDDATSRLMSRPRCGLPDRTRLSLLVHDAKWEKQDLTWLIRSENKKYKHAIEQAFAKWNTIIPQFTFRQVCSTCDADILLSFQSIVHGREKHIEDNRFSEGVLAHAYYPKDGTIHFNNQIQWSDKYHNNEMFNLYLVAIHEIGHALGYMYKGNVHNLDDSSSIMYPIYSNLNNDNLFTDADKKAMQNIYPDITIEHGITWYKDNWAYGCNFNGNDLNNTHHTPADQCGRTCFRTRGCTHFTWTEDNNGTCWMKESFVSKNDAVQVSKNSTICGIVHKKNDISGEINWDGNNWAHGCDFHGGDLNNIQTTVDQCGPTCAATSNCTHFTWTQDNNGTCWMKQGLISKSDAISKNSQSIVCGINPTTNDNIQINWNGNPWALGCDFSGRDLISVQTVASDCGRQCDQTDKCTHFTWTPENDGICWMKQGLISKNDAFPTNNSRMVCGIIVRVKNNNDERINWIDNVASACDFNETDLHSVKTTSKDCTHFTWNNFNGGACWMKQGLLQKIVLLLLMMKQ